MTTSLKNKTENFKNSVEDIKDGVKGKFGKLKKSLEDLKEITNQNNEARSARIDFNSDDVLLEKNMLLFLDHLLKNLFGENEKVKTIIEIKDAIKESENLSKEQIAEKIRDSMKNSNLLAQEKNKMLAILNNEKTKDFIQKIYNFKVNEISEISKSSLPEEAISKKVSETTSLDPVSIIKANDSTMIEELKSSEKEVLEKASGILVKDLNKEVTKDVVKNLLRVG